MALKKAGGPMGFGDAQKMAKYIIGDDVATVKFLPRNKAGMRYAAGFSVYGGPGSFVPLVTGASWEDVMRKLRILRADAKAREAALKTEAAP